MYTALCCASNRPRHGGQGFGRAGLVALRLVTLLVLGATSFIVQADDVRIKPFVSDGCSAWPDGTLAQSTLWLSCCEVHDVAYWQGGTRLDRQVADEALGDCVADIGQPQMGAVMLAGVRVGGSPWWPTSFRWGYGWAWPRGYGALSDAEQQAVAASRQSN